MIDLTFRVLSNEHRRRILTELLEVHKNGGVCVPEEVVAEEEELDTVHVALTHRHLPLLEETGFVEWDVSAHIVHRGDKFDEVRPLLRLLTANPHKLPGEWA